MREYKVRIEDYESGRVYGAIWTDYCDDSGCLAVNYDALPDTGQIQVLEMWWQP